MDPENSDGASCDSLQELTIRIAAKLSTDTQGDTMWLAVLWRRLTQTVALEQCSGRFEKEFFDSMYRITYFFGLSVEERCYGYFLYRCAVKCLLGLFVASELWYLFSESSDLDTIIDSINVTTIHLIAGYRYKNMMDNTNVYRRLAAAMESKNFDITHPRRKHLLKFWLETSQKYMKLLIGLGSCTLSIWYVFPLIDDVEYNLPVALRLPIDFRTPLLYPITYIVVTIVFNHISFFVMVNDVILQVFLLHLLCQFNVLADCFENITQEHLVRNGIRSGDGFDRTRYLKRLGDLVDQHRFILNNAEILKQKLSTPMLLQFVASSILICFAGYQVSATIKESTAKFLMSLLYLGYNLFVLFVFCRWCNEIKIKSEYISEVVYSSGWEGGASAIPGVRARLLLVMARARRPAVLTAGGLYDLSLASYTYLVKTSYSALTVLLRVRND